MVDPNKQRYVPKMLEWAQEHMNELKGKVTEVDVLHDDDCPFLRGCGDCNCEPDFQWRELK